MKLKFNKKFFADIPKQLKQVTLVKQYLKYHWNVSRTRLSWEHLDLLNSDGKKYVTFKDWYEKNQNKEFEKARINIMHLLAFGSLVTVGTLYANKRNEDDCFIGDLFVTSFTIAAGYTVGYFNPFTLPVVVCAIGLGQVSKVVRKRTDKVSRQIVVEKCKKTYEETLFLYSKKDAHFRDSPHLQSFDAFLENETRFNRLFQ